MESNSSQLPSFFKVLIGDFAKKLQIPLAFEGKFNVTIPQNVTIKAKKGASKWHVKVDESLCFRGDGWEKLVADNDLKYGDFLVFRLISNKVLDVVIYGKHGCEKVVFNTKSSDVETCVDDVDVSDEDGENLTAAVDGSSSIKHKSSPTRAGSSCRRLGRPRIVEGNERKNNQCFDVVLKSYHKSYVTIPKAFAYEVGIEEKEYVVLKNEQEKAWPVYLRKRARTGRIDTGVGWQNFWDDNKLKEKDSCLFKFVSGSANIIQVEISPAK